MRMRKLAAVVAILVCVAAAPASASDWNVGNGLWGNGANWLPAGVPTGTNANIANTGSATLQTAVPTITTFDLTGGSDLTINAGADLTTTGNAVIATGAFNDGYVSQVGGTLSLGADLILGNGADTYGEWIMSDGSVEVATDLTLGSGGDGVFNMSDGGLTVHGGIAVADSSGLGTMTLSGGTLLQDGVADSLSVGGSGSGTLRIEGDIPSIDVANYQQGAGGSLDLELNDNGITTIFAIGDATLNGALNVTIKPATSPTPGIYDILVADGVRTGSFSSKSLPAGVKLRYEEIGTDFVVRLYVGVEPPAVELGIIDSFDEGPQYLSAHGVGLEDIYIGSGPIGDERRIYCRNASTTPHSTLDINGGSVSLPGEVLATAGGGGAERIIGWGQSDEGDTDWSDGNQLNLDVPDDATIEVDVAEVISNHNDNNYFPVLKLFVNGGAEVFTYGLGLGTVTDVPQTVVLNLNDPDSGTWDPGDLADVDGIRLRWYDTFQTRITELRFVVPGGPGGEVPEPAGLGVIGLALLAVRKRRS